MFVNIIQVIFGAYLEQLLKNPLRTKCITSCVLFICANVTSQKISGAKKLNTRSVLAFAIFGLIFGGPTPHFFYQIVEFLFRDAYYKRILSFMVERLVYAPIFQTLSLYFLSIFEGNSHTSTIKNMKKLYWTLLKTNWRFMSFFTFLNTAFVPIKLRSVTTSFIAFCWILYMAQRRRRLQEKISAEKSK
ncbi:peroxisomal membrane protein PMP22-like [Scaptodrosophila lebanonensis]|uniref:Peroxisomal membrane protein PMP22-like n=1 Tax=Drosophila lebanonensis TaxID=7225 RepID=A0A6J2TW30_DROLE|nr:peroxisomal membrane protein PMP22-like [Scaptodrosophila lebanonensis]